MVDTDVLVGLLVAVPDLADVFGGLVEEGTDDEDGRAEDVDAATVVVLVAVTTSVLVAVQEASISNESPTAARRMVRVLLLVVPLWTAGFRFGRPFPHYGIPAQDTDWPNCP